MSNGLRAALLLLVLAFTLVAMADARRWVTPNAEGCVVTSLSPGCDITFRGRLGVGDCTLEDGTYVDFYSFPAVAGKIVVIDVRPISSTMTKPLVALLPPSSDASKTPAIGGGNGASVSYLISSTGTWEIAVGTTDLFSSGEYFVSVRCFIDNDPSLPQNCVLQSLVCGQRAEWNLTSQSCRFGGGSTRLYSDFAIYGVVNDVLTITQSSFDFAPLFGIYDSNNKLLASSSTVSSSKQSLTYVIPQTGFYSIAATSQLDAKTGFFSLDVTCSRSGCLEPLIVAQPSASPQRVKADTQVPLTLTASGTEPMTYRWRIYSGQFDFGSPIGTGSSILSPPLKATSSFGANVSNVCGDNDSALVTVTVDPARRRSARH